MIDLPGKAVVRTTFLQDPTLTVVSHSRVYTVGAAKAEASRQQRRMDKWYPGKYTLEVVPLRIEMLEPLK